MAITDEQAKTIKAQILKQIESLPKEKQGQIREYISSMNNQQLEEFLRKNAEMQRAPSSDTNEAQEINKNGSAQQCIMCLISSKKIESLIIYEDKDYLAALEINPFSKGHTILIPKAHIAEAKSLKSKAFTIANKIGKHILKKLEAESFQVNSSEELGHAIVNIIPIYKGQKITYERKPAKKADLEELKRLIGELKKKEKVIKIRTEKSEEVKEKQKSDKKELREKKYPTISRRIP